MVGRNAESVSVAFEVSAAFALGEAIPTTAEDLGYRFGHGCLKARTS
jgi:hypothetical protein